MSKLYAEDIGHYWKTGTSSPDTWIDKTRREIAAAKGKVIDEAFRRDETGRAAFLLEFSFDSERFRIVWPVLESRTGNEKAARIQAATFLYHDVKARCMAAKVLGKRAAFFNYLLLSDGRTAGQIAAPELVNLYPKMLTARGGR